MRGSWSGSSSKRCCKTGAGCGRASLAARSEEEGATWPPAAVARAGLVAAVGPLGTRRRLRRRVLCVRRRCRYVPLGQLETSWKARSPMARAPRAPAEPASGIGAARPPLAASAATALSSANVPPSCFQAGCRCCRQRHLLPQSLSQYSFEMPLLGTCCGRKTPKARPYVRHGAVSRVPIAHWRHADFR